MALERAQQTNGATRVITTRGPSGGRRRARAPLTLPMRPLLRCLMLQLVAVAWGDRDRRHQQHKGRGRQQRAGKPARKEFKPGAAQYQRQQQLEPDSLAPATAVALAADTPLQLPVSRILGGISYTSHQPWPDRWWSWWWSWWISLESWWTSHWTARWAARWAGSGAAMCNLPLHQLVNAEREVCLNEGLQADSAGEGRPPPYYYYCDAFIPVWHTDDQPPANDAMEELNLWLGVGPQALASPPWSGLVYRPGRIIAFPDTTDALRYIGLENGGSDYVLNEGVWLGSFNKAEGMRLLTAALAGSFDTILFYRHLDASQTRCADGARVLGRCCPSPNRSTFARVMVGLHGWNRSRCPGHENLTYHSRECPCSAPPRSKGVDVWTC